MSLGFKKLAKKMYGKTYVFTSVNIPNVEYSRENCRKLINEGILKPKLIKGITRHKPKKIDKLNQKTRWITQVRKLRSLWRIYKAKDLERKYTDKFRKIYRLIKANKINTKNKLISRVDEIFKN